MVTKTSPWTSARVAAGAGIAALSVIAMRSAWLDIAQIAWVDEESNQVLLAVPVMIWLFVMRKHLILRVPPETSLYGPVLMAIGALVCYYGYTQATQVFWHAGAVAMLLGSVWTVFGTAVIRSMLPIIGVMLFLVPVPAAIRLQFARPLQEFTAEAAHVVLIAIGQDSRQAGMMIYIDGKQAVRIDEACNGMRMLFSLLLVCYAYAMVNPLRAWVRILIIGLSPVMALLANVLRVVPTALVYAKNSSKNMGDFFHSVDGWLMTILAFLLLMGLIRLLEWAQIPVRQGSSPKPSGQGGGV